jgi:hypothetical protein
MIQRVQSLFLLLTILLSVLFPVGVIIRFSEGANEIFLRYDGISKAAQGTDAESLKQIFPLTVLMLIIPFLSMIIIFLYKKRKLQMRLIVFLIILIVAEIIALGYYVFYIAGSFNAELTFGIKLIIPALMLISSLLAYRFIKKDEDLVRSYDRLR